MDTFGCRLTGVMPSSVAGVKAGLVLVETCQNHRWSFVSLRLDSQDVMPWARISREDLHAPVTELLQFWLLTSIANGFAGIVANVWNCPLSHWLWRGPKSETLVEVRHGFSA